MNRLSVPWTTSACRRRAGNDPEAAPGRPARSGRDGRLRLIDVGLAAVLALAVLIVHDVPYLLHHSFWVDEAWVADTVRARIGLTPSLASSTPLGWTYLLRLVPFGGAQRLRLVPLAFAMLAAAAGYLFGRELRLTRFATGVLTGAAVLLSPAMLVRDDLKQYTAEAFACLAVWILVARVENEWGRRRLAAIAATASLGLLFANTVIFVGVAAMACLALECLVTRHYRRLAEVAVAAAGMLAVALVIYATLIRPQVTPRLVAYWDPFYMPTTERVGRGLVPPPAPGPASAVHGLSAPGRRAAGPGGHRGPGLAPAARARRPVPGDPGDRHRRERGARVSVRGRADLHVLARHRPAADGGGGGGRRASRGRGRPPRITRSRGPLGAPGAAGRGGPGAGRLGPGDGQLHPVPRHTQRGRPLRGHLPRQPLPARGRRHRQLRRQLRVRVLLPRATPRSRSVRWAPTGTSSLTPGCRGWS